MAGEIMRVQTPEEAEEEAVASHLAILEAEPEALALSSSAGDIRIYFVL